MVGVMRAMLMSVMERQKEYIPEFNGLRLSDCWLVAQLHPDILEGKDKSRMTILELAAIFVVFPGPIR